VQAHDAVFDVIKAGVLRGAQAVLDLLSFLEKIKPKFSGEFTVVARGMPRDGYARYHTPDGKVHQFWDERGVQGVA
jgi:hypothetical protein